MTSGRARILLLVLAVALLWARIDLAVVRAFDPDELQHFHSAFLMTQGQAPFVDYFEHHPPLFGALLSVLVRIGGPDMGTLVAGRVLMGVCSLALLFAVYWAIRGVTSKTVGLYAVLLLSATLLFLDKSIEVRPDVPASLAFWIAVGFCMRGRDLPAGALCGLALAFTPKLAFCVLGVFLTLGCPRRYLRFAAGGALVLAGAAASYASTGILGGFIDEVVVSASQWKRELGPGRFLLVLLASSLPLLALAFGGLGKLARDKQLRPLLGALVGTAIGWFWIPVPWPQFLLPALPILAVAAALAIEERAFYPAAMAFAAGIVGVGLVPEHSGLDLILTNAIGAAALAATFAFTRHRDLAVVAFVCAAGSLPYLDRRQWTGEAWRTEYDYVMRHTEPEDSVLTGWTGCAVWRPSAYRHYALHPGVLAMLSDEEKGARVIEALEEHRPALVVRDAGVAGLGEEVQAYLDLHYQSVGVGSLHERK